MYAPSSARNKSEKALNTMRFFKKAVGTTDENEKNGVNYLEKLNIKKLNHLTQVKKSNENKNNRKGSVNNLTTISHKTLKTQGIAPLSTKNSDMHGKSFKHLKLTSSTEFPKILIKSISQTTMNKKSEEKTLKLLEKIGNAGAGEKKIKKRSSCLINQPSN